MNDNVKPEIFERIDKLFDVSSMRDISVLIVGCGSGGSSVALQLAMSGVGKFILIDNDILGYENVIRHVCGIRFIGMKKVDALSEVLTDRNPELILKKFDANVFDIERTVLEAEIRNAAVVIIATDNESSRYYINELCVNNETPHVTARVFTRGIGGEVFAYRPKVGGCLACLETALDRTTIREGTKEIDLVTEDEREKMYGMEIPEIKDSPGLNVDISFISSFHTRFALDEISKQLPERPKYMMPIPENYLIWGNRPVPPFNKNFQIQRIIQHPLEDCLVCSTKNKCNG